MEFDLYRENILSRFSWPNSLSLTICKDNVLAEMKQEKFILFPYLT